MITTLFLNLLLSQFLRADMGRDLVLSGQLQAFDEKIAIVKTDKGEAKVPASSIDKKHVRTGQWVTIFVPIEDFVRLNKEKLEKPDSSSPRTNSK